MRWFESATDIEAQERLPQFWKDLGAGEQAGEFWADQIRRLRDDPGKRLAMALEHLPLPRAFKEAAVALRAIIRERRKSNEPFEQYLAWLYWLAAAYSFMDPFSERLREPGYNVMESVPGQVIRSLDFDYSNLGHQKLDLLNKTDRKWLVECWGEPDQHSTLNALHRNVWDEYEKKLIARRPDGKPSRKMPSPGRALPASREIKTKPSTLHALPGGTATNKAIFWWVGVLIVVAVIVLLLFR